MAALGDSECCVCLLDVKVRIALESCKHWLCPVCLAAIIDDPSLPQRCPMCRAQFNFQEQSSQVGAVGAANDYCKTPSAAASKCADIETNKLPDFTVNTHPCGPHKIFIVRRHAFHDRGIFDIQVTIDGGTTDSFHDIPFGSKLLLPSIIHELILHASSVEYASLPTRKIFYNFWNGLNA